MFILFLALSIVLENSYLSDYFFNGFLIVGFMLIASIICCMIIFCKKESNPQAIDVYRGKTELKLTGYYDDSVFVVTDTTVIFKNK